jgi:hypothetical protein
MIMTATTLSRQFPTNAGFWILIPGSGVRKPPLVGNLIYLRGLDLGGGMPNQQHHSKFRRDNALADITLNVAAVVGWSPD